MATAGPPVSPGRKRQQRLDMLERKRIIESILENPKRKKIFETLSPLYWRLVDKETDYPEYSWGIQGYEGEDLTKEVFAVICELEDSR